MENKLQDALNAGDWYSAHQIYLALAQKHQRGKRQKELIETLAQGTITLAQAGQTNSANQLADRLINSLNENDNLEFVPLVFESLWKMENSSAIKFANSLVEKNIKASACLAKAASQAECEEAGRYALLTGDQNMIKEYGESLLNREEAFCRFIVRCLISKNFAESANLLSMKISQQPDKKLIDDPSGNLPSFTAITGKPLLNFCQLLFLACQRKSPKKGFKDLVKEYEGTVREVIPADWLSMLEKVYWPEAQTTPMNPLAQMMQNFLRPPNPPLHDEPVRQERIDDLD